MNLTKNPIKRKKKRKSKKFKLLLPLVSLLNLKLLVLLVLLTLQPETIIIIVLTLQIAEMQILGAKMTETTGIVEMVTGDSYVTMMGITDALMTKIHETPVQIFLSILKIIVLIVVRFLLFSLLILSAKNPTINLRHSEPIILLKVLVVLVVPRLILVLIEFPRLILLFPLLVPLFPINPHILLNLLPLLLLSPGQIIFNSPLIHLLCQLIPPPQIFHLLPRLFTPQNLLYIVDLR